MLEIVVVEDHIQLRETWIDFLSRPQWSVRGVGHGKALDLALLQKEAHIVLLDLNLPFEDGLSIAKRLRVRYPGIGIVMVTARSSQSERAAGYDLGADIYLTKPVEPSEIEAVISALARRIMPERPRGYALDTAQLKMHFYGASQQQVSITTQECNLLYKLATSPNRQASLDDLMRLVCLNDNRELAYSNLRVLLSRLRQKLVHGLTPDGAALIKSVRQFGYQLTSPIEIVAL